MRGVEEVFLLTLSLTWLFHAGWFLEGATTDRFLISQASKI